MYYCHQCRSFYAVNDSSRNVTECVACHSPLIEAVQSAAHREELSRLMEQQQRAEEARQPQLFFQPFGHMDSIELQFHSPLPMRHLFHILFSGGDVPHGPSVDELMRSFHQFPHGLRETDRSAHPEAFLESACLICLEPLLAAEVEEERDGGAPSSSTRPEAPPTTGTTGSSSSSSGAGSTVPTATPPATTTTSATETSSEGHSVVILPCKHCYHAECIRTWLRQSRQCPLCRASVLPRVNMTSGVPSSAPSTHVDPTQEIR